VTGYLPREHPLVKNGSFGDRFVEGIYLRADHDTPCIRMYCFTSGSELLVQDFKSYPDEIPFRDPSCLLRCTQVILKDLAKMHIDDAHDDNLVAEETALHAHTRAQTRAADAAKALDDSIILTTSPDEQTERIYRRNRPPAAARQNRPAAAARLRYHHRRNRHAAAARLNRPTAAARLCYHH